MDLFEELLNSITASPLFFLSYALMIRCLLLSFYCLLLYSGVCLVRKFLSDKMSVRANYYSWYALLLSLPLSGLWWNSAVKTPLYLRYLDQWQPGKGLVICRAVLLIWLLIVLFRLASQLYASLKAGRAIGKMDAFADQHGLKQQAADAIGLRGQRICVRVSDRVSSPVSYGMLRKTILLPRDYEERYSTSELYLLLLHEMAHLKNHDTLKLYLIAFAECFIWVLPLFYRPFKQDTEILCDSRVIGIQGQRIAYGELLLKESASKAEVRGFAFSDSYRIISSRLHAINAYRPVRHRLAFFSLAVFALLLLAAGWSYRHHAEWFFYNENFNADFVVAATFDDLAGSGQYYMRALSGVPAHGDLWPLYELAEPVDSRPLSFDGIYEVVDGEIIIDKLALYEAAKPFDRQDMPIAWVTLMSTNYRVQFSDIRFSGQTPGYTFEIGELAAADENSRYHIAPLKNRGLEAIVYQLVAHWG